MPTTLTAPPEDGAGAAASMKAALEDAAIGRSRSSTSMPTLPLGTARRPWRDHCHQAAFGACRDQAHGQLHPSRSPGICSAQPCAVEAIFQHPRRCATGPCRRPSICKPDEGIGLDLVPNTSRQAPLDIVMSIPSALAAPTVHADLQACLGAATDRGCRAAASDPAGKSMKSSCPQRTQKAQRLRWGLLRFVHVPRTWVAATESLDPETIQVHS